MVHAEGVRLPSLFDIVPNAVPGPAHPIARHWKGRLQFEAERLVECGGDQEFAQQEPRVQKSTRIVICRLVRTS